MKQRFYFILICVALGIAACSKKISDDNPLPISYMPNVLLPTDAGILYSFDAETGKRIWEFNTATSTNSASKINCTPVMDYAENVYFAANNSYLYCVDAKLGTQKWKYLLKGFNGSSPCFGGDNRVYIGADSLYCINTNGTKVWAKSLEATVVNISTAITAKDGYLFVAAKQKIYCIDQLNGNMLWVYTASGSEFKSSPTVRDGKVYCGMVNGQVKCLNQTTGAQVWSYNFPSEVIATPMVRGDMCIVGGFDNSIRSIDAVAGTASFRWKLNTAERISSSATIDVDRETVYVGSNDFNLYAINHVTGDLRWKFPTGSIIKCSPVLYNNKIYFTSFDKYLYAVDVATGKLAWKVNVNVINQELSSPIVNGTVGQTYYPTISGNSTH